ncbi:hypothetical protein FJT64_001798 [Amphibalanus amphitrite]|uniref:BED-type domain-containing protein n=1 Tax=Amphibalanus amphitrite TaxID=1232801 RepID=A0A6A4XCR6_AMPAM|nr:hypothetical protein FJT64_001798 [Amphibalanus amphitrite]
MSIENRTHETGAAELSCDCAALCEMVTWPGTCRQTPARSRPADPEPPAPKRRRAEPVPARSQSPPAADAAAVAVSPSAERRPEPAAQPADKTVNISVSIKAEGMSDTMVGELLEHSQSAPMLDPDMEPGGSDVVERSRSSSSFAWNQFTRLDPETVSCNLCLKSYRHPTSASTSNLWRHLERYHQLHRHTE